MLSLLAILPLWLEPDSATAIDRRVEADFSMPYEQAIEAITEKYPAVSAADIDALASEHYIELMDINGERRMHHKSVRNLGLLNPALNGGQQNRGERASAYRFAIADSVIAAGKLGKRVHYRYTIEVPYDEALKGETLRVWMPFPIESERQTGVKLIGATGEYQLSASPTAEVGSPVHRTIYMTAEVKDGEPTVFGYEAEYTAWGKYVSAEYIAANIKPYDTSSELYRRYTAMEAPHIVDLGELAREVVGDETDPYLQSELVYEYITGKYLWAGAREYSTLPCIPQYVIDEAHGDCGQVALLYISMMRSLGVPARWESGWYLLPGELGIHDWAEVYYEGVGWVPVDVSFGRYTQAESEAVRNFHSTGIDPYRLACNLGVCGKFTPEKRYIRSETVDSQLGEVECSKGNLFYPGWKRRMEILTIENDK